MCITYRHDMTLAVKSGVKPQYNQLANTFNLDQCKILSFGKELMLIYVKSMQNGCLFFVQKEKKSVFVPQ